MSVPQLTLKDVETPAYFAFLDGSRGIGLRSLYGWFPIVEKEPHRFKLQPHERSAGHEHRPVMLRDLAKEAQEAGAELYFY